MDKEIWIRADGPSEKDARKRLVTDALEKGVGKIMIRKEDEDFRGLGRFDPVVREGDILSDDGRKGRYVDLASPEDQEGAVALAGKVDFLVVSPADWKVIPLENLIAAFQGSGTRLMACARNAQEAKLFMETLERGVDGIVADLDDPKDMDAFLSASSGPSLDLKEATVTEVRNLGMGDRVCIDTCSMMSPGEGMLIGSQSNCLFQVQSESEESGYVASRPFRVNAGAVHAYVLTPGSKTRYLSEIKSGDPVLLVGKDGRTREGIVGRCKIERRPLMLLKAEVDGKEYTTIVQNAETVRMCTPQGSKSVAEIGVGDKVMVKAESVGRHFGMAVEETIREI